jgi:hypothetical protein
MATTTVNIATTGESYSLPGDHYTVDDIVRNLKGGVPGMASMDASQETDSDGNVEFTFRAKTGTKG